MNDGIFRTLFNGLSLAGRRLTVVLFHRVLPAPDPLLPDEPDVQRFAGILRWLAGTFAVMTLRDAVAALEHGRLPRRALVITFDDGYADNATQALPALQAAGLPATFFATTRFLDGGLMWNDRVIEAVRAWQGPVIDLSRHGLPRATIGVRRHDAIDTLLGAMKYLDFDRREAIATELLQESGSQVTRLMMDTSQLRQLHGAGMEIGAHTHSHPILARLGRDQARTEMATNKALLEQIIGAPVTSFAYPNGRLGTDFTAEHGAIAAELGFTCAVTTMPGTAATLAHRFELPRLAPWDRTRARYLARLARHYFDSPPVSAAA
ncbi:MAG: polysaccharide deacetylase family protein [Chromatiales bacterium]|jgi:peptidoglycan/xylan/chitin deacetylase (PgdA/CDA1 family)|nr:polysaccharide deacetylase family protein [Chromatiales bacterium]